MRPRVMSGGNCAISKSVLLALFIGFLSLSLTLPACASSLPKPEIRKASENTIRMKVNAYIDQSEAGCDPSVLDRFLHRGLDLPVDEDRPSPLIQALSRGAEQCAIMLLKHGAMAGIQSPAGPYGVLALQTAVSTNVCSPKVVKMLIERGADVNAISAWKQSALLNAALSKHVACSTVLIRAGANVNDTSYKTTPLMEALTTGFTDPENSVEARFEMAQLLLKNGAYPNARKEGGKAKGMTPLFLAVGLLSPSLPCAECAALLLKYGAKPNIVDSAGRTPMLWALAPKNRTNLAAIKVLVAGGADVNFANAKTGETPLMAAVAKGYEKIVKYLLKEGAKLNVKDGNGKSALDYARERHQKEIANLLSGCRENKEEADSGLAC